MRFLYLGDFEAEVLQDAAGHLADHPAVVDDEAGLHGALQILERQDGAIRVKER